MLWRSARIMTIRSSLVAVWIRFVANLLNANWLTGCHVVLVLDADWMPGCQVVSVLDADWQARF